MGEMCQITVHEALDKPSAKRSDLVWRVYPPGQVTAPSLTPDSYNYDYQFKKCVGVVAPSLTPDSYNKPLLAQSLQCVVAPSLTPDSYNSLRNYGEDSVVVAPSLTPDSYNSQPLL